MWDKAVGNYTHALKFAPNCYITTKKMRDKAINAYLSNIEYVFAQFKTQEMCDKAVDKWAFVFDSVPDQHKTQKCVAELFLKILLC